MRVELLELQNFCQHRRIELTFGNGLIAVIGPNGSGKSNLLGAMRLSLTGDNPNVGAKADNVSQFAAKGERSYVKLRFSHGNTTATVTRNLYPASPAASLEEAGKPTISGDKLVTARICEILGTNVEVINDIVIVAQADIFGFLEKTPTKRAEQFQRLFRTDDAATAYDLLNKQLNRLPTLPPYTAEQLATLRAAVVQIEAELVACDALLATLSPVAECDAVIARWETIYREAQAAAMLRSDQANCQQQLTETLAHEATVTGQRQSLAIAVDKLTRDLDASHAAEVAAQATLEAAGFYEKHAANVVEVKRQQREQEAAFAALVPPTPPAGYPDPDIDTRINELTHAHRGASHHCVMIDASLAAAIARCPACAAPADPRIRFEESGAALAAKHGGALAAEISRVTALVPVTAVDVSSLIAKRAAAAAEVTRLAPLIAGEQAKAKAIRDYVVRDQQYQQALKAISTAQSQLASYLQQLGNAPEVSGDVAAAKHACGESARIKQDLTQARTQLSEADRALGILAGRIVGMRELLAKQRSAIETVPADLAAQAVTAVTALPAWRAQRTQRIAEEQRRPTLALKRDQLRQQLTAAEEAMVVADEARAWRDHVAAMAALVHCNAAPRFVAQQNLQRLQLAVNDYLEMFQAEFRVTADEGLSFTANFNDGVRRQPAERLSGGQQVLLALSFRLATNLQLAAGIGGLYLDEPTAYLDKTHIRGFEPALARLRQFCESRGFQCVIVTHETGLAPLFDSVVDLGASAACA